MTKSIQQLREERNDHAKAYKNEMGNWNDDTSPAVVKELGDKMDALDVQTKAYERCVALDAESDRAVQDHADTHSVSVDEATDQVSREQGLYSAWLRNGYEGLTPEQHEYAQQRRRLAAEQAGGDPARGGYLVPREASGTIIEQLEAFGGMREVATTHNTSTGAPIDWPTSNRTGRRGVWLGENQRAGDQDVNFGTKPMGAHMLSSEAVIVPWSLLQDEHYNLIGYINAELVERIGRSSNEAMTTGDGTGKPTGIVEGASLGATGATAAGVTYDEVVDLEHSVNRAYRKDASWMFSDNTLKVLKKLKDADGRPLWRPGVVGGDPDDILGYGYTINDDMADMGASEKPMLFGDMSRYVIRQVMDVGLYRLTGDEHTRKAQTGFLAWTRLDGKLMDVSGESVKFFQNAA